MLNRQVCVLLKNRYQTIKVNALVFDLVEPDQALILRGRGGSEIGPTAYTEGPTNTKWLPNVDSNHEPSD
jgi:hypothetical protein